LNNGKAVNLLEGESLLHTERSSSYHPENSEKKGDFVSIEGAVS